MADTDLIERELRERAEYRAKTGGPFTKENLVEWRAATALAEKDAQYERLAGRMDAMAADNQRLRAECEGLRAAVRLAKKDILEWVSSFPNADHTGSLNALAEIDAALSQKETGDEQR